MHISWALPWGRLQECGCLLVSEARLPSGITSSDPPNTPPHSHTHAHTCTQTHRHTDTHTLTQTQIRQCTHIDRNSQGCRHTYTYTHTHTHKHTYTHIYTKTHTSTHTDMHTLTQTHTHTHTEIHAHSYSHYAWGSVCSGGEVRQWHGNRPRGKGSITQRGPNYKTGIFTGKHIS